MKSKKLDARHTETGNHSPISNKRFLGLNKNASVSNGTKPAGKNKLIPSAHEVFRLIHGTDDRESVNTSQFPHQSICLLKIEANNGSLYFGTGFFISSRCVITAGHCVFFEGNWAKSITVVPGATGDGLGPFGEETATRFKSVTGWTANGNDNFDYGAVLLDDDALFNRINTCMKCISDSAQQQIAIAGYPEDKGKTQWKSKGEVVRRSKFRIYYELDTVIGNSGSPIYDLTGKANTIIGVHTQGQKLNYGVRLIPEVIERLNAWSKL